MQVIAAHHSFLVRAVEGLLLGHATLLPAMTTLQNDAMRFCRWVAAHKYKCHCSAWVCITL